MVIIFDHAKHRHLAPKPLQHALGNTHMAKTAVNHKHAGQRGKLLISVLPALQPPRQHFFHRLVVILPVCHRFNTESAVSAALGLSVFKDNHGADGIGSGKIGNIIRFKCRGRLRQSHHAAEQFQRFLSALSRGLRANDFLPRIFPRQIHQLASSAALRHRQCDFLSRNRAQKFADRIQLLNWMRNQHQSRHNTSHRIILLEVVTQQFRAVLLRSTIQHGVFFVVQISCDIMQHNQTALCLALHKCQNIHIRKAARHNHLMLSGALNRPHAVAQLCRLFKALLLRRLQHIALQLCRKRFVVPFQNANRLRHALCILLL